MLIEGDNPVMESTGGFERPNVTRPTDSRYCRSPSISRMSKPSVDLPDPDSPVRTTSFPFGILSVMFFRLCSRALEIVIQGSIESNLHLNEARQGYASRAIYPHSKTLVHRRRVCSDWRCFAGSPGFDDLLEQGNQAQRDL